MSSLKDLASLIMVPSLVKDGRLDTVKPLGNSIIHPDATGNNDGTDGSTPAEGNFTFSRGSNLAATRVDVNGLIEKGRENLFTYSNDFSNSSWLKADTSVTGGQADKDGTNNAWLLEITGSTGFQTIRKQPISYSGVNTFSFYAKAGTLSWLRVNTSVANTYFDIGNGVVGSTDSSIGASIEAAGNGYYRCVVPVEGSSSVFFIYPASGDGNVSQSSGNLYIQDAQWEKSMVATDYIETGASTAQAGILEDLPRLDYSGGASCPSLLLESQRSNLSAHSEYLNASSWATGNLYGTLTDNAAASPEGLNNAASMIANATNNAHYFDETSYSAILGSDYTFSFFVKSNGSDFVQIATSTGFLSKYQNYNISTGELAGGDAIAAGYVPTIKAIGSNGWYRVSLKATTTSTKARFLIIPIITDTTRNASFVGNGDGIYVWGIQKEQGSYPTSYIPTMGSAVTRSREVSSLTGFDFFSNGEGTALIEFEINETTILSYPELFRIFNPSDATNFLYCYIFEPSAGDVKIGYRLDVNNSKKIEAAASIALGTNKIVVRLQRGAYTAYLNGTEIAPSQEYNDVADVNMTTLRIYAQTYIANERIKQFLTFPTPLTDSECIALTSL